MHELHTHTRTPNSLMMLKVRRASIPRARTNRWSSCLLRSVSLILHANNITLRQWGAGRQTPSVWLSVACDGRLRQYNPISQPSMASGASCCVFRDAALPSIRTESVCVHMSGQYIVLLLYAGMINIEFCFEESTSAASSFVSGI